MLQGASRLFRVVRVVLSRCANATLLQGASRLLRVVRGVLSRVRECNIAQSCARGVVLDFEGGDVEGWMDGGGWY